MICVFQTLTGSLDIAAKAMEVDIAKAGLHMLIEKPISMRPAEEVERLSQVGSCMPCHRSCLNMLLCTSQLCTPDINAELIRSMSLNSPDQGMHVLLSPRAFDHMHKVSCHLHMHGNRHALCRC